MLHCKCSRAHIFHSASCCCSSVIASHISIDNHKYIRRAWPCARWNEKCQWLFCLLISNMLFSFPADRVRASAFAFIHSLIFSACLHYTHAHTPSMRIIIGISIESNIRATAAAVLYLHTFISNFQSGVCAHGLLKTVSAAAFYKFIHFVNKKKAIHDARAKGKKNKIVLNWIVEFPEWETRKYEKFAQRRQRWCWSEA